MKLFTAETFGPVVAMTKFDGSEEEAIRLANNSGKSECIIVADRFPPVSSVVISNVTNTFTTRDNLCRIWTWEFCLHQRHRKSQSNRLVD
jgi:hypothetical protein